MNKFISQNMLKNIEILIFNLILICANTLAVTFIKSIRNNKFCLVLGII